ncbi:MAG TPA: fumarylacetoacetate hydrolase family protein [Thermoanaerobaculia bacterium]|nr:fumarylacetoacetate hydrolase family protein [Thermoanaerobaculia bacterium]
MKLLRFVSDAGSAWGVLEGNTVTRLEGAPWYGVRRVAGTEMDLEYAALLPASEPTKILGIGRNYGEHAKELGQEVPKEPMVFVKALSSLIPPGGVVLMPPESQRVDYEGELAIVVGKRARRVGPHAWREFVLGFTCAIDVTCRDLQQTDGQWWRAKGYDTFCPLGPWIETELDPSDLALTTRVDGAVRQSARTSSMLFDVGTLVAHVSSAMTLEPGDVILTGTPEGVGALAPGNRVEVSIEGIGTLAVSVAAERA